MAGKLYLDTQVSCYMNMGAWQGGEDGKLRMDAVMEELEENQADIEKVKREFAMLAAATPRPINEEGDFGGQTFNWEEWVEMRLTYAFQELEELYRKRFTLQEFKANINDVQIDF